ncbi:2Fe-2S iron-sulfur cluster-binding protein [Nocardia sp. NPDC052278]|uniref:2Fe-2S iron-sulfur cluster-binding protein n=1 Tax=unclassified Nocardia TaxID=2637762 RepID=UPI00369875AE
MLDPVVHKMRVIDVVAETADSRSLVFEVPDEFRYTPGQFLTLRIPAAGGAIARCYSLASSPHTGEAPKVTVKRVSGGLASNWICDHIAPGDVIETLLPAGVFTPKALSSDLLFFAGGSGITPVMSIIKSALHAGTGHIALVYANSDDRSVIFAEELALLARTHPVRLVVIHWLVSVQGLPEVAQLREIVRPFTSREAYLCGPEPYMAAASDALRLLDFPRERIHIEKFVSLERDPFRSPAADQPDSNLDDAARVEVDLDGELTTHAWPRGRPLLDVLLNAGMAAPYSCREGACSACACRVLDGEVKMLRNEILEEEDLTAGYVLACQAVPVSDAVKITYS